MPLDAERRETIVQKVATHIDRLQDFRRVRFWQRLQLPLDRAPTYQRVAGLPEATLIDLADYLDTDLAPDPDWPINGPRLFVSHLAAARGTFDQLKLEFGNLRVIFFLAHDDIHPGDEWRSALLRALKSMDALISIHSDGFAQSPWANQEVGFALARDVPIVAILNGEAPSGFLAQVQGFRWQVGQEAQLVQSILNRLNQWEDIQPKLGEGLANALKRSDSYQESDRIVAALSKCQRLSEQALRDIDLACSFNDQVHQSGAEGLLSELIDRLGYKITLSPQVRRREANSSTRCLAKGCVRFRSPQPKSFRSAIS